MDSLKAAVQNGADAIYLGGKVLSARASAKNFDYDEIMKQSYTPTLEMSRYT